MLPQLVSSPFFVFTQLLLLITTQRGCYAVREPIYKCISNKELANIHFGPDHVDNFETLVDYEKKIVAHRNTDKKLCFIQTTLSSANPQIVKSGCLTNSQLKHFAGDIIHDFCWGYKALLVGSAEPSEENSTNQLSSDILETIVVQYSPRVRRDVAPLSVNQFSSPYRGRYRGQTQSQYLNFNGDSTPPGRAEAESTPTGSRAVVSGKNGMGQAQSQSGFSSGCEDCYGSSHVIDSYAGKIKTPYTPAIHEGIGRMYPDSEVVGPGIGAKYPSKVKYDDGSKTFGQDDRSKIFTGYPPATGIRNDFERQHGFQPSGQTVYQRGPIPGTISRDKLGSGYNLSPGRSDIHDSQTDYRARERGQQPGQYRTQEWKPGHDGTSREGMRLQDFDPNIPRKQESEYTQRPGVTTGHMDEIGIQHGRIPEQKRVNEHAPGTFYAVTGPQQRQHETQEIDHPSIGNLPIVHHIIPEYYDKQRSRQPDVTITTQPGFPPGTYTPGSYQSPGTFEEVTGPFRTAVGDQRGYKETTSDRHFDTSGYDTQQGMPGLHRFQPGSQVIGPPGSYEISPGTQQGTAGSRQLIPGTEQPESYYRPPGIQQGTHGAYPSTPEIGMPGSYETFRGQAAPGAYQSPPGTYQQGAPESYITPGTRQGAPGSKIATPGTQQGAPGFYISSPGTEQGAPGSYVAPPGTQQGAPTSYVSPPGTQQGAPGSYISPSGTQQGAPGSYIATSGTRQGAPGSNIATPGTQQGAPGFHISSPGTDQGAPGSYVAPPGSQQGAPGSYISPSGTQQRAPGSYVAPPVTQQGAPESYVSPPGTQQGAPGSYISPSGTQQGAPGSYVAPPRTQQGAPASYSASPGTQQGTPGSYQPSQGTGISGSYQNVPGTQQGTPGSYQPSQGTGISGSYQNVPGTQLGTPGFYHTPGTQQGPPGSQPATQYSTPGFYQIPQVPGSTIPSFRQTPSYHRETPGSYHVVPGTRHDVSYYTPPQSGGSGKHQLIPDTQRPGSVIGPPGTSQIGSPGSQISTPGSYQTSPGVPGSYYPDPGSRPGELHPPGYYENIPESRDRTSGIQQGLHGSYQREYGQEIPRGSQIPPNRGSYYVPQTNEGIGYYPGKQEYDRRYDSYQVPGSHGGAGKIDNNGRGQIYPPSESHVSQQWDGRIPTKTEQYNVHRPGEGERKATSVEGFGEEDDANSQAETSIKRLENGTFASSLSNGVYGGGSAQTQISGTYSGSGSFSAQAQTIEANRGAQSQIIAGDKGVLSSAQGRGGRGQSQVQMQLGSEMGETIAEAQSIGINHGTNTQVKASSKGGLADAQASGPGSTSSQAQIGFQPQDQSYESSNGDGPFHGGGTASAQSGKYEGQTQTQIQGRFKYGISYTGAAQAGSGIKDGGAKNKTFMTPLNLFETKNARIDRETINTPKTENKPEDPPKDLLEESESNFYDNVQLPIHIENNKIQNVNNEVKISPKYSMNQKQGSSFKMETTESYDRNDKNNKDFINEDYEESEEDDYEGDFYQSTKATHQELNQPREVVIQQGGRGQKQHIILPMNKHGIQIVKDSASKDILREGMVFQPGEEIPGTNGYTIPIGFRGRISSVSAGDGTFAYADENGESQAQTITLTPGNGNVTYVKPSRNNWSHPQQRRVTKVNSNNLRSSFLIDNPDGYVTVTKSVTGELNPDKPDSKKFSHTYYTKSSTCGYFTYTCNIVYGSNGRTKICKQKAPINPDGTPINC